MLTKEFFSEKLRRREDGDPGMFALWLKTDVIFALREIIEAADGYLAAEVSYITAKNPTGREALGEGTLTAIIPYESILLVLDHGARPDAEAGRLAP